MTEEVTPVVESARRERSSFTMDKSLLTLLKAKALAENVSVSSMLEKAVAHFLGV